MSRKMWSGGDTNMDVPRSLFFVMYICAYDAVVYAITDLGFDGVTVS